MARPTISGSGPRKDAASAKKRRKRPVVINGAICYLRAGELGSVKVTYSPYKELVVHEIVKQDEKTLFEDMVRQALMNPAHAEPTVNWAEGVAFVFSPMPPTEDVIKEGIEGRVHYASVMYAKVPYQSKVSVRIGNQDYSVRLRKADDSLSMVDLAKFLRDFKAEDHESS